MYLPPLFPLMEFDEAMAAGAGSRSLVHWNGLVTEAAAQVLLGWSDGSGREVIVGTRQYDGKWPAPSVLRLDALYLAAVAPIDEGLRPLMSLEQWQAAHETVDVDDWTVVEVEIQSEPVPAQLLVLPTGAVGAALHANRVVSFSLRGLTQPPLRLSNVTSDAAAAYQQNPLEPAEH